MSIGANIKHYRLIMNKTQKQLGEDANISEKTIQKYELGIRNPKLVQVEKIAQALGISPALLLENKFTTYGDVLAAIIALDEAVCLKFDNASRDEQGRLNPKSITISIADDNANELVADWEAVRHKFYTKLMASYGDYSEKKLLAYKADDDYKKAFERLLIEKANIEAIKKDSTSDIEVE